MRQLKGLGRIAAALCAALAASSPAHAETWSLAADWSAGANPSADGVWTYGFSDDLTTISRALFTLSSPNWLQGYYGFNNQPAWCWPTWTSMGLGKMTGLNSVDAPAGRVAGFGWSGFLWRAPRACTVNVYGGVWKTHAAAAPQALVVAVKGVKLVDKTVIPLRSAGFTSSNVYTLYQAALDSGSAPEALNAVVMTPGDAICVQVDQVYPYNVDLTGFDFTVTEDPLPPGSLSGRVVRWDNGAAVAGALVSLTGAAGTRTATATSDGSFAFTGVQPGGYRLAAEAAGFFRASVNTGVNPARAVTRNITLTEGLRLTVGEAKQRIQGTACQIRGIVTAVFSNCPPFQPSEGGCFFLQAEDRSAAIRVYPLPSPRPQPGMELVVTGRVGPGSGFEQSDVQQTGRTGVAVRPLRLATPQMSGAGADTGPSNLGLLVKMTGRVECEAAPCPGYELRLHISDGTLRGGSSVETWAGWTAPAGSVEVVIPPDIAAGSAGLLPCAGDWVSVTGICWPGYPKSGAVRGVYIRSLSDIEVHQRAQ